MDRNIPPLNQTLLAWMRHVDDQLDKLNRGAQNAGRVSFGTEIQVGKVLIQVSASGDTVTFTNVTDGKHATIALV